MGVTAVNPHHARSCSRDLGAAEDPSTAPHGPWNKGSQQGEIAPPPPTGGEGAIWQCLETLLMVMTGELLLASCGCELETLLSAPQGVQDDPPPHPTLNTDPSGP